MHEACHRYLLPIGGTATAALAGLLHEAGDRVSGVDSALYPPTSELLAELGIPVRVGFDPSAIPDDVDEVIIGNALPRTNVEIEAVLARGLPYTSQAQALGERFCRPARTVVVAGTHGKTTTTALTTHIFTVGGLDPTALI
ncbi:MAG: Mur ligase domain-containing protein, partial [Thermoanaerobaculales bacterium]